MDSNYLIILFKNKSRYKIIKKYQTYKKCLDYFNFLTNKSNEVIFDVQTENGRDVKYELGLLKRDKKEILKLFKTDDLGRNISIELNDPDFSLMRIEPYRLDEKIYDINKKQKISVTKLIESNLKSNELKLISKLNNKIIIQEDDKFSLYSTKSSYDAIRLLNSLQEYMINNNKKNCLIVMDTSSEQKKYLYQVLSELGYDKKMLYRNSTTHLKDK